MKYFKKYSKFFQVLSAVALCLALTPVGYALDQGGENYFDVLYNNFSGLPTSEANDIIQTKDGSIWIASYSSLVRYDGKDFVSYADTLGLTSVLCLFVDEQERLWIGTNNNGVVLYENNEFHFISEGQDIPSFSTRSISQLEDGSLLVGTALGMYKIAPDFSIEVLEDSRIADAFVSELVPFGKNQTFGITKTGDLFVLDGVEIVYFLPVEQWGYDLPLSVLPVAESNGEDGYYYLIGTNGDYMVKMAQDYQENMGVSYEIIPTGELKYINSLMMDSRNRVWICSDSGVGYMEEDGTVSHLDYLSSSQSVESVIEDFEGNYWLASSKVGVLKLNPSMFKNITANLPDVVQFNGVELVDGFIYVVSSNGIDIIRQEDLTPIENELTQRYRGEYFRCVRRDEEGNLWFSSYTDDALVKYTPKTEEISVFSEEKGIDYTRIRSTMTARDGKIWVATGNGVYVVEDDQVIHYFGSDSGMQNLEILTLSEDPQGRVFAGTDGAGVYVLEGDQVVERISRETGLLSDIILRTETDPFNGGTWIVTGNSIAFYDNDTKDVRVVENFPYGNNFDLMFHEDTMIVLCSIGIFFVSHESMMAGGELEYLHYNHLNGLYSSAVANSFSIIEDGVLYLCGYQNLTAFDMNGEDIEVTYVPPVELPGILVNDGFIYPGEDNSYYLPHTANFVQLDIFIPTYALQDYSVAYGLLGYDQMMHHADYVDYIDPTYTNLPGGDYVFWIQLTDNRTGEVVNENQITIVKEYSFSEHPTTKFTLACLLILGAGFLIRFVVKLREKKSREKQAELTGMFHDTVEVLSNVIDAKDCYTNGHSRRVAYYTKTIAKAMSFSEDEVDSAYVVALLHDVGKISIPDNVLNKPGRLDNDEFDVMKTHASRGADILEGIKARPELVVGAKYHHERFDGTGYANGLKGEEIPQIARIIGVADAFDAMYSSRVYRKKMPLEVVISELEVNSGTQFDPEIVKVLVDLVKSGELNGKLEDFSQEDAQETIKTE